MFQRYQQWLLSCTVFPGSCDNATVVTDKVEVEQDLNKEGASKYVNQYELTRELGEGSFGTVYLAKNTINKNLFAIKEIDKARLHRRGRARLGAEPEPTGLDSIKQEIEILKRVRHVNVIHLFEVLNSETSDYLFMVFDLCEGGPVLTMESAEPVKPLKEQKCKAYFFQLLEGLGYLHSQSICHRDIKMDNLLVTSNGTLKICDFGSAQVFQQEYCMNDKSVGTPAFNAPELLLDLNKPVSVIKCDIWSMGVTLYCMLSGRLPFQAETEFEMFQAIKTCEPCWNINIGVQAKDLLRQLLQRNPTDRLALVDCRKHAWMTTKKSQSAIAAKRPTTPTQKPQKTAEL